MTTKERLHQLVDRMDEGRAGAWLAVIDLDTGSANGHHAEPDGEDIAGVARREHELIASARPTIDDHPIWGIVGIASSAEPTDMANHKDE